MPGAPPKTAASKAAIVHCRAALLAVKTAFGRATFPAIKSTPQPLKGKKIIPPAVVVNILKQRGASSFAGKALREFMAGKLPHLLAFSPRCVLLMFSSDSLQSTPARKSGPVSGVKRREGLMQRQLGSCLRRSPS